MNINEKNGEKFLLETYLQARLICQQVTEEIIQAIQPGMLEVDGQALIKETFKKHGVTTFWHPSKFRIGSNTTKTFRDISDPETRCERGDLCFVDIGPVIHDHEADFGRTFVIGGESESRKKDFPKLIDACQRVFKRTADVWRTEGKSGVELYNFADAYSRELGYQMNPLMAGHRLGDFPHHVHSKQKLNEYTETPSKNLWVLEIHIRDEVNDRGAFFEDILI